MFCKACGARIDDDSRFCKECGVPQGTSVSRPVRSVEVCEIRQENAEKGAGDFLRGMVLPVTKIRFIARVGAKTLATGPVYEISTRSYDDKQEAAARQALIEVMQADGWEPIVDPGSGRILSMRREI